MALAPIAAASSACGISTSSASESIPPDARTKAVHVAPVASRAVPGTEPKGELAFLGPVRTVEAGGITVGYRQFGHGAPVVLVVGQGSTMAMWGTELPRRLAERHQVTMYDLRGVGYTTDPATSPLTIGLMADDLASLIDTLGLSRPTLVGWSTGGEIALSFATRHPDKAGALVLSGATAGGPPAVQPDAATDAAYRSGGIGELLDLSFTASGEERRNAYVQQVLEVIDVSPDDAFPLHESVDRRQDQAEQAFAADPSVFRALSQVDLPTLVTNGADDRLVPPANAELIARQMPRAALTIYDDTAHVMWFQHLDRFVRDVESMTATA